MTQHDDTPLTDGERMALAEFIIRRRNAGAMEMPIADIVTAIEAIKATFATLPVRQRNGAR